jgi:serine/threonine protein phosphatase PrpC
MPIGIVRDAGRHHFDVDLDVAAGVSDRGLRHVRNEDALFLAVTGDSAIAVVCDGVSSSAAPQVAAQVAADAAGDVIVSSSAAVSEPISIADVVVASLDAAMQAVLGVPWMPSRPDDDAPSCTIVAAVWDGSTITCGWSGDSRAYWLGEGGAHQLTSDHSWAQMQIDAGLASVDQAHADWRAHSITRWLGPDSPNEPIPIVRFDPPGSGRLVVCSDGLWNHVDSLSDLASVVDAAITPRPLDVARALVARALELGGHDNVTVAVIDVVPASVTNQEDLP